MAAPDTTTTETLGWVVLDPTGFIVNDHVEPVTAAVQRARAGDSTDPGHQVARVVLDHG